MSCLYYLHGGSILLTSDDFDPTELVSLSILIIATVSMTTRYSGSKGTQWYYSNTVSSIGNVCADPECVKTDLSVISQCLICKRSEDVSPISVANQVL